MQQQGSSTFHHHHQERARPLSVELAPAAKLPALLTPWLGPNA